MRYFITILVLAISTFAYAQDSYKKVNMSSERVLTVSQGYFDEVHEHKELERIGSVIINTKTRKIERILTDDELAEESRIAPDVVTRWLSPDPLAAKFPYASPYNSFGNNPVLYVDSDGRENMIYIVFLPGDKTTLSLEDMKKVASETQNYYQATLGIDVKVQIFDQKNNGQFEIKHMDASDAVVVIGDRTKVADFSSALLSKDDNFQKEISIFKNRSDPEDNPESSQNTHLLDNSEMGKVIMVDGNLLGNNAISAAAAGGKIEEAKFLIIHGSGHNASINHEGNDESLGQYISQWSFMASAQSIYDEKVGKYGEGWNLDDYLYSDESKSLIPLLKAKFSANCAYDNYCTNYNESIQNNSSKKGTSK
jgi:hypothetical protein